MNSLKVAKESSVYESEPVGPKDQPDYYNMVLEVETSLPAAELLRAAQMVEIELGRVKADRWGPRPIDVDILLYGGETIAVDELRVPHPEMLKRLFVMVPLVEVASDIRLPDGTLVGTVLSERRPPGSLRKIGNL